MADDGPSSAIAPSGWQTKAEHLVTALARTGLDGAGRWKGARQVADEIADSALTRSDAVNRLVATHVRMVAVGGFLTGVGGLLTLPVTLPADVSAFYVLSTRMVGGIAHLNGYDIDTEEVRSVVLVSLLGAGGTTILTEAGVKLSTNVAKAAIAQVPGKVLMEINRQVGFRLLTKAGTTGVVNLTKIVPFVGGVAGAGVNYAGIKGIARQARSTFVALVDDGSDQAASAHV